MQHRRVGRYRFTERPFNWPSGVFLLRKSIRANFEKKKMGGGGFFSIMHFKKKVDVEHIINISAYRCLAFVHYQTNLMGGSNTLP